MDERLENTSSMLFNKSALSYFNQFQ